MRPPYRPFTTGDTIPDSGEPLTSKAHAIGIPFMSQVTLLPPISRLIGIGEAADLC